MPPSSNTLSLPANSTTASVDGGSSTAIIAGVSVAAAALVAAVLVGALLYVRKQKRLGGGAGKEAGGGPPPAGLHANWGTTAAALDVELGNKAVAAPPTLPSMLPLFDTRTVLDTHTSNSTAPTGNTLPSMLPFTLSHTGSHSSAGQQGSFDPLAPGGGSGMPPAAPSRASSAQFTENLRPWEVRWQEFTFIKKIGGGSFGKASGHVTCAVLTCSKPTTNILIVVVTG